MKLNLIEKMLIVAIAGFSVTVILGAYTHKRACSAAGGVSLVDSNKWGLGVRKCFVKESLQEIPLDKSSQQPKKVNYRDQL